MPADLVRERELEYIADSHADSETDFWRARCLRPNCDYEFQTREPIHPLCPACEGPAEVG